MAPFSNQKAVFTGKPGTQMQAILERLAIEDAGLGDPTLLPAHEGRELSSLANLRWNQELPDLERVDSLWMTGGDNNLLEGRLFTPRQKKQWFDFFYTRWRICILRYRHT